MTVGAKDVSPIGFKAVKLTVNKIIGGAVFI
jgi:hypothetical protein